MFGRRCTLCGGKLDSHNICKECGLDNSKSEKNYRVNQSSCDHEPLTHVHLEKEIGEQYQYKAQYKDQNKDQNKTQNRKPLERKDVKKKSYQYAGGNTARTGKKKNGILGKLIIIIVVVKVIAAVIGMVGDILADERWDPVNQIYMYEYEDVKEENMLDDIRLLNGAISAAIASTDYMEFYRLY